MTVVLSGLLAPDESHTVEEGVLYKLRVVLAPALAAMTHPPLVQRPLVKVDARCRSLCTNATRSFFECFPYVCPEPVLVKSSFLYINGSKRTFCYLRAVWRWCRATSNCSERKQFVTTRPNCSFSFFFGGGRSIEAFNLDGMYIFCKCPEQVRPARGVVAGH